MWASRTLSGKLNDPTVIVAPGRPAAGACADEPCPPEAVHAAHSMASARQTERRASPRPCILSSCALPPRAGQCLRAGTGRKQPPSTGRLSIFSLRQINDVALFLPGCAVDN